MIGKQLFECAVAKVHNFNASNWTSMILMCTGKNCCKVRLGGHVPINLYFTILYIFNLCHFCQTFYLTLHRSPEGLPDIRIKSDIGKLFVCFSGQMSRCSTCSNFVKLFILLRSNWAVPRA